MKMDQLALGGLMVGCIAIGAASAIGLGGSSILRSPPPAAMAAIEPDWDVNSFISVAEGKRRSELKSARESEAFQKIMSAAYQQLEKSIIEGSLGHCEVEIDGLRDSNYPLLEIAVTQELRRRGFGDVRYVTGINGKWVLWIELPYRPWNQ